MRLLHSTTTPENRSVNYDHTRHFNAKTWYTEHTESVENRGKRPTTHENDDDNGKWHIYTCALTTNQPEPKSNANPNLKPQSY